MWAGGGGGGARGGGAVRAQSWELNLSHPEWREGPLSSAGYFYFPHCLSAPSHGRMVISLAWRFPDLFYRSSLKNVSFSNLRDRERMLVGR